MYIFTRTQQYLRKYVRINISVLLYTLCSRCIYLHNSIYVQSAVAININRMFDAGDSNASNFTHAVFKVYMVRFIVKYYNLDMIGSLHTCFIQIPPPFFLLFTTIQSR